ncbi:MAG TPA: potassium transporter TrkA [Bacteroidales bacterium]|nr:potassium transporter TrkA [Bacteroidales bacterium]
MKFIVIGLGLFGSALAAKLTRYGNEVIGVDSQMSKVEALKDVLTHVVCLDSTDPQAAANLPVMDTDVVIVSIGEDEGANIKTTALMKQMKAKRIISRAISPLHEMILEAMGVDEILRPEEKMAERWALKLNTRGVVDSFELKGDYTIIEAVIPKHLFGKKLEDAGLRRNYKVVVLSTIEQVNSRSLFGRAKQQSIIQEPASGETVLNDGDKFILYGKKEDIHRMLEENG